MAEKKKPDENEVAGFNPQPVHIGGESLVDRILPHVKKILAVIGIFALVVSIFLVWRWWQQRKSDKATAALVVALDHAARPVVEPEEATGDAGVPAPEPAEGPKEESYASHTERAEAALARLRAVGGEQRDGAALLEADLLFELGKLDEAERAYRKAASRRDIEGEVAREGIGHVAEAKGELEKALEAFRAAQPDDAGPRREYALYHEGRILAQMGKKDEARAAFDKALAKAREVASGLETTIEVRMTQLDAPATDAPKETPTP